MTQEEKDRKEMDEDPLKRLQKRRTKRLTEAFLADIKEAEMFEEDREMLEELGINHY